MKKLLIFLTVVASLIAKGQPTNSQYKTVTIGPWKLDYFPTMYLNKGEHLHVELLRQFGRVVSWMQVNDRGAIEGLRVNYSTDYIHPAEAFYYHNGQGVYSAEYFPRSYIASWIRNKDMNENELGPQVQRYDDGRDQITWASEEQRLNDEVDQKNLAVNVTWNDHNLLDGSFEGYLSASYFKGIAVDGRIHTVKFFNTVDNSTTQVDFLPDSIRITSVEPTKRDPKKNDSTVSYVKIVRHLKLTNDPALSKRPGYFYCRTIRDSKLAINEMITAPAPSPKPKKK